MKKIYILYFILIHIVLFTLVLKTNFIDLLLTKININEPNSQYVSIRHKVILETIEPLIIGGNPVFLGDSITEGLLVNLVDPEGINFGIGGQTSSQLKANLKYYDSIENARYVSIMIGANDILNNRQKDIIQSYQGILNFIPENTSIIWSGLMPIKNKNEIVKSINQDLKQLCEERKSCKYINNYEIFSKYKHSELFRDSVHPNYKGYKIWAQQLKKSIEDID